MSLKRFAFEYPSTRSDKEAEVRFGAFRSAEKELVEYSSDSGSDNELNQFVAKFSRVRDRISERDVRKPDYESSRLQSRHQGDSFSFRRNPQGSELVGDSYRLRNPGDPCFKARPSSPIPGDDDSYEEDFVDDTSKRIDPNLDSNGLPRYYIPDPNNPPPNLSSYSDPYYNRDKESVKHRNKPEGRYNEYIEDDPYVKQTFRGESSKSQGESDYYQKRFNEKYEYGVYGKHVSSSPPGSKEKDQNKRYYGEVFESQTRVSRPLSPTPEFSGARKKFCDSDLRNAPIHPGERSVLPVIKPPEKLYIKDQPSYPLEERSFISYPEKSDFGRNYYGNQEKSCNKDNPYPEEDRRNYSEKSDFCRKTDDRQEREKSRDWDKQYLREDRSVRHYSEKSDFGQRYDGSDKLYLRGDRSVRHYSEKSDLVRKYDSHEQNKFYYKDNTREYSREDQSVRHYSEKSDLNRKFDSPERDKMYNKDKPYSREDQIMKNYPEKNEFSQKYDSQDAEKHRSKKYREDNESQRYELNLYDVSKSERSSKNRESGTQGGGGKLSFDVDMEMGPPLKKRFPVKQKDRSPSLERVSSGRPSQLSPHENLPYHRSSPLGRGYEYGRKIMADAERPALSPLPSWSERREKKERYSTERMRSEEMTAAVNEPDSMIPPPPPPPILSGLLHSPPPPTFQPTDYSQPLPHISRSHPPSGMFDYVQAGPLNIEGPQIETIKKKIKESYIRKKASKGTFFPVSRKYKLSDNISPIIYTNFCALNYNKTKQPKTIIWESGSVRMLKMKGDPNYQKKGAVFKGSANVQAANLEKEASLTSESKGIPKTVMYPAPSERSIELNQTAKAIPSCTTGGIGSNVTSTSYGGITAPSYPLTQQNVYQYQTGYYSQTVAATAGVVESQGQNSIFPGMVTQSNILNYFGFQTPNPQGYPNYAPPLAVNPVFQNPTPAVTTTMDQVFHRTTPAVSAAAVAMDENWNSWNPKLVYPPPPLFQKVPSPAVTSSKEKNKQNTNLIVCNQYPKPSSSDKQTFTSPKTQILSSETRSDNRSLITIPINNPIVNKPLGNNESTKSYKPQKSKKPVSTNKDEDDDVVFISETYICRDKGKSEPKVNLDNLIKSAEDKETKQHHKSGQNDKPSINQSIYKSVQEVIHQLKSCEPNEAKPIVKMDNKNHPQKILPLKEQNTLAPKCGGPDSSKLQNQNETTVKSSGQIKKPITKSDNPTVDKPNVVKLNLSDKNKTTQDPPITSQVPTKGSNIVGTSGDSMNSKNNKSFFNNDVGSKPVATKVTQVLSKTVDSKFTKINSSLSSEPHETIVDSGSSDKAPKVLGETIAKPNEVTVISSKVAEPEKLLDTQKYREPKAALNDKIPIETIGETPKETVPINDDKNKHDLDNRSIETKILVKSEVDLLQKIPFNVFEGPSELSNKISKVQCSKPSLFNIKKSLNKSSCYKNYSTCNGMLCFKFRPGDSPLIVTDCIGDEIVSLVHNYMHGVTIKTFLDFFNKNFCEVREAAKKFENLTKSCDVCLKLNKADSVKDREPETNDGIQTAAGVDGDKQKTGNCIIGKIKLIQSSSKIVEEISEKIMKKETDEYFFKGDLLLKKCFIEGNRELKIFLPDDKIDDVIKIYHSESLSHGPEDKVLTILKKHFSPVNDLLSPIKSCIENCGVCQQK